MLNIFKRIRDLEDRVEQTTQNLYKRYDELLNSDYHINVSLNKLENRVTPFMNKLSERLNALEIKRNEVSNLPANSMVKGPMEPNHSELWFITLDNGRFLTTAYINAITDTSVKLTQTTIFGHPLARTVPKEDVLFIRKIK